MADLIIRGMEMPQRCKACRFCGFGGRMSELNVCMFTGESQPKLSQERMSKCPLLPLPEGHGRMIDAERFRVILCRLKDRMVDDEAIHAVQWAIECLDKLDTIVPAEGGGEDA